MNVERQAISRSLFPAVMSGALAFGAAGASLALAGAGVPLLVAIVVTSIAVALVMLAVLSGRSTPMRTGAADATAQLEAYRVHTAALRHDIRGVLSPALMMSDRLLNHEDQAVQRAGKAVVRSVERATALLAEHKDTLSPEASPQD